MCTKKARIMPLIAVKVYSEKGLDRCRGNACRAHIFLAACQLDADLVRQADGDFADLLQPALAHAVLSRAGV